MDSMKEVNLPLFRQEMCEEWDLIKVLNKLNNDGYDLISMCCPDSRYPMILCVFKLRKSCTSN
jgi:hypothetical protein